MAFQPKASLLTAASPAQQPISLCACTHSHSKRHRHAHQVHAAAAPVRRSNYAQPRRPLTAALRFDPLHLTRCSGAASASAAAAGGSEPDDQQPCESSGSGAASGGSGGGSSRAGDSRSVRPGQTNDVSGMLDALRDSEALPESFCLIESRDSVKNFATLQLSEINDNIMSRRNRIFLLMEEVRRLRIQQRVKGEGQAQPDQLPEEKFDSAIPWLPPITEDTIQDYWKMYLVTVAAIITFGGLLAPVLEVHLGLGGASYQEFISSLRLPGQLAAVDPIVASFCGGAVGCLSTLMVVEANNASQQHKRKCFYCQGTGYLTCGACVGSGQGEDGGGGCNLCSGTGKVMCTACLCTGKMMATEHDPRLDPLQ